MIWALAPSETVTLLASIKAGSIVLHGHGRAVVARSDVALHLGDKPVACTRPDTTTIPPKTAAGVG